MKFHSRLAVVLAVARIAASQYLPACADSCLGFTDTSSSSSSECNAFDLSCSCTNKAYLDAGVCCLHESCTDSAREEADAYARSLCSSAGYVMPTGISCSTISVASDAQSTATAGSDKSSATAGSKADSTADSLATDTSISETSADSAFQGLPTSDDSSSSSSDNSYSTKRRKSHTLKTGLGVGLGVGIPLISAVVGYLALLRRRKSRQANMANTQQPPMAAYQAPPPQGYPPQGFPPQNQPPSGYPPQGWHPEGFVVSPPATQSPPSQSSTPLKYEPSSSPDGTTHQHEMMGTTPSPRQELHSDAQPNPPPPNELHSNPQLPNELHSTPRPLNPLTELP